MKPEKKIKVCIVIIAIIIVACIIVHGEMENQTTEDVSLPWNQRIIDQAYNIFCEIILDEYGITLPENNFSVGKIEKNGKELLHLHTTVSVDTLFGMESVLFWAHIQVPENGKVTRENVYVCEGAMDGLYLTENDLLYSHSMFNKYYQLLDTEYKKEAFIERMKGQTATWTIEVYEVTADDGLLDCASIISNHDNYYCEFNFNNTEEDSLSDISPGDVITITGVFKYVGSQKSTQYTLQK